MPKQLIYDAEAREKLKTGVDKLANAVRITLGPKGRNVVLDKKFGSPSVTNDGVTIAKEIELADPFENLGAQMVKEVATKTQDVAGDGTTTATILAQAMIAEGIKNVTAGANPMFLKKGIQKATEAVVAEIKRKSTTIKMTKEGIGSVATISANNDDEIGSLIAEAMIKVGKDGVITVEEAKGLETTLEVVEGMQFDRGYLAVLRDGRRAHGVRPRERADPDLREEGLLHEGPSPHPRAGRQAESPLPHHRGGRRGRGAGDPGRQQAARHPAGVRGQGARLR